MSDIEKVIARVRMTRFAGYSEDILDARQLADHITELQAKLDAVTEGLALLAEGSTPWMLWRKGEGPGEGRSVWEAMADYAKQLLSAAIGEQE